MRVDAATRRPEPASLKRSCPRFPSFPRVARVVRMTIGPSLRGNVRMTVGPSRMGRVTIAEKRLFSRKFTHGIRDAKRSN